MPVEKVEEKPVSDSNGNLGYKNQHKLLFSLIGVLLVLLILLVGIRIGGHNNDGFYTNTKIGRGPGMMSRGFTTYGDGERGFMNGGTTLMNGRTRTDGVVTAVNGDGFAIAGHGATSNITTNSSTQYQNGNTVKVNDSVLVFGTNNSGTITATQIVINP